MKILYLFALLGAISLTACKPDSDTDAHALTWVAHIGGGGPELVYDITTTDDGRVCTAGTFWATVTFGEGDEAVTLSTPSTQDIFVACYNGSGGLTSVTQFGTHRGEEVRSITALPGGDVVITGFFSRTFGTGHAYELKAADSADIFVARIDSNGDVVWAKRFGGAGPDNGTALTTTADGDLLLAGSFSNTFTFPIGDRLGKLNSAGSADAMVMKLTPAGEVIWARRLGGEGYDQATAVEEGADGRVVIGGYFEGSAQLEDSQPGVESAGFNDVFVASLSAVGAPVWLRELGGPRQETLNGLVVDDDGGVHIAGSFQQEMSVQGTTLQSNGSTDVFLISLASNGAIDQAVSIGSKHTDQVFDMSLDHDGSRHYIGQFQGQIDFDPQGSQRQSKTAREGDANAYLLTLDAAGRFKNVWTAGGIGVEMGMAVSGLHNAPGFVAAGIFNKGFDAQIPSVKSLPNAGKSDVFVLYSAPR